jgi:ABC-2 type transport system ATP-binding protein
LNSGTFATVPAVDVKGLVKRYGPLEAVRGIDFSVEPGEVVALLGPNGAGKTTTLEILEGFLPRSAGTVEVLGRDPADADRGWRERVGIVLQGAVVEPYLRVGEVLERNAGYYPRPRAVSDVVDLVGLSEKVDARVKTLSGGQQRRLDVALGIIGAPELLFLDEPTTGFDPSARRGAWDLVEKLRGEGTTIILTTHYMDEAQHLADRVIVINRGEIVASGTPETIGGRAEAAVRIRFAVAGDIDAAALPIPADRDGHGMFVLETTDEVRMLHALTTWALDRGVDLVGLTVDRPSLEDVYLELTSAEVPEVAE